MILLEAKNPKANSKFLIQIQNDITKMVDALIALESTPTNNLVLRNAQIVELEGLIKIWAEEFKRFSEVE